MQLEAGLFQECRDRVRPAPVEGELDALAESLSEMAGLVADLKSKENEAARDQHPTKL